MMKQLINILSRTLSKEQAHLEAKFIIQELPKAEHISAAKRRSNNEPLQYILGSQPFGPLDLKCMPGVLIPRNDTESWVMKLASFLPAHCNIWDFYTGSGCIGLTLASVADQVKDVWCVDVSDAAIRLTNENLKRNKEIITPPVHIIKQNLLEKVFLPKCEGLKVLVANPPYIPQDKMNVENGVEISVLKYEPDLALVGDLEHYSQLCNIVEKGEIDAWVFELGYKSQADEVINKISKIKLEEGRFLHKPKWNTGLWFDDGNKLRCVVGWKRNGVIDLEHFCNDNQQEQNHSNKKNDV